MIVTLTIINVTQCLLIVKMRKSKTYTEVMTPTTIESESPEAFTLHKIANISEEVEYVK